ncbi:hypothetical protein EVG20_g674 [Dentipellis fragilis]|uniref:Uncharacterized protein n=1 Tax=Dentipellis fragilis TaxID=205917 RepID=A0A4Y9ZC31_9AGAM|nr:hypothetical protein EVG20_g674 [Dentipellis fragilis]
MFHPPKHPTLSRRKHLVVTLIFILFVLLLRHAWGTSHPRQFAQPHALGGQWRAVHAVLGVANSPAYSDSDATPDTPAFTLAPVPFVPRFDLRKRAALINEAKGRSAPLFLARDAIREPVADLENMRRSYREGAAKGRGHEHETGSAGSRARDSERDGRRETLAAAARRPCELCC